jgi:hypothetical protein
MKKSTMFRTLPLILGLLLLGSVLMAQTKEEKEVKEAELKAKQEQIEIQRKQMKEQQLKTRELERSLAEQAREASRARTSTWVYPGSTGFGEEPSLYFVSEDQENQSQLTIRNTFDGNSSNSKGEFDVDESTRHIRFRMNGKVRSGEISIRVIYPGGKVFKELSMTSPTDISFTQSITINEEEKKKYVGSWQYEVSADKAEGSYSLSFSTH